jgi:hypothetical protein
LLIDRDILTEAIEDTRKVADIARAKEYDAWRQRFRPHGLIVPERDVPSPIFVAAVCGGPEKLLRINIDWMRPPITYVHQAISALPDGIPAFGKVVGVVINYSPDRAVRFSLKGRPLEVYGCALRPGQTTINIGGKSIDERLLAKLLQSG